MEPKTKFEGLDFVDLNNRLAKLHPDQVEKVEKFKSEDDARAVVNTALQVTGERLIRMLKPDHVSRGTTARLYAKFVDGQFVSEYVELCVQASLDRGLAVCNVRSCHSKGLIKIYG